MDRLNWNRCPIRSSITKTLGQVEAELAKEESDLRLLRIKLVKFEELVDSVTELDRQILDAMFDAQCTQEKQDEESDTIDEYRDKVGDAISLIKDLFPK